MPGPGGSWLPRPASTASAATAAISAGPSVSGNPCPRLIEAVSTASADISAKIVVPMPASALFSTCRVICPPLARVLARGPALRPAAARRARRYPLLAATRRAGAGLAARPGCGFSRHRVSCGTLVPGGTVVLRGPVLPGDTRLTGVMTPAHRDREDDHV